ncbi:MAG: hypothetical protein PHW32_01215 [Bacilli bacterium]|nr:hypothetical protein [Bacilli bacterium]MDD4282830.1 hypothetical protein [Bacilli bacterium]MDD4719116.1 hypothetical protein [Bacilli bacterium]
MERVDVKTLLSPSCRLITSGSEAIIIELEDGSILKLFDRFKLQNQLEYEKFIFVKETKVRISKKFKEINSISLPEKIVYDNNDFVVYTMDKINDDTFSNFFNKNIQNQTIEVIAKYCYNLEKEVKKCHEKGIIIPDLLTRGNVRYNPDSEKVTLIDYDGFQIENLPTRDISSLIRPYYNSWLFDKKYYNGHLFDSNIDKLSIIIYFLLYTTNINVADQTITKNKIKCVSDILDFVELDDEAMRYKILKLYDMNNDNEYLDKDLLRISNLYNLEKHDEISKIRKFVKKI